MKNISIQECINWSQYDQMRSNVGADGIDGTGVKCIDARGIWWRKRVWKIGGKLGRWKRRKKKEMKQKNMPRKKASQDGIKRTRLSKWRKRRKTAKLCGKKNYYDEDIF